MLCESALRQQLVCYDMQGFTAAPLGLLSMRPRDAVAPPRDACAHSHNRRKRIAELAAGAARLRFGSLEQIRGSEFVTQVTNAGEGVWVVCHLFKDRCGQLMLAGQGGSGLVGECRSAAASGHVACKVGLGSATGVVVPSHQASSCLKRWAWAPDSHPHHQPSLHPPPPSPPAASVQDCSILNQCLAEVAKQYPATKFVKIVSTGGCGMCRHYCTVTSGLAGEAGAAAAALQRLPPPCRRLCCLLRWRCPPPTPTTNTPTRSSPIPHAECIPNYPDENLPTVLLYKDTKCVHSIVGLRHFGGRETSPELVSGQRRWVGESWVGGGGERRQLGRPASHSVQLAAGGHTGLDTL